MTPPKWQHKAYGPLNAYFQIKFPADNFLVKPQALLRNETADEPISGQSIDSRGVAVGGERQYPDFTIERFYGADSDSNPRPDIICVIVEVGSLYDHDTRDEIATQLHDYMDDAGDRYQGWLLGIGICGNEVYLAEIVTNRGQGIEKIFRGKGWIRFFDRRFLNKLDEMYDYSMANH